jgi:hypothetical protein
LQVWPDQSAVGMVFAKAIEGNSNYEDKNIVG